MTMIIGRQPVVAIPLPVRCHETQFERFATLLVLRLMDITRKDLHSGDPARITEARIFAHSMHAETLAAGIGFDIEWLRRAMDIHYFVELPDLNTGRRFRSHIRPVVVRGDVEILPSNDQFVRIVCQEPHEFACDYPAFTSVDWLEVPGPARWLSDDEYVALLDVVCGDRRYVQAARAEALARRSR